MTHQELKKVIDFYNNVILQQIIKPLEITEIYKLVCPECDSYINYKVKQRAISVYVQNLQKEVIKEMEDFFKGIDSTETTLPKNGELESVGTVENQPLQSHSEDAKIEVTEATNQKLSIAESYFLYSIAKSSEIDSEEITDEEVMETLAEKELENNQLSDNHQSENSDNGDNQVVETNLKLVAKPKRTRKPNKKK